MGKWTFRIAGIYGVLVTLPLFFTEGQIGRDYPPAVNHVEFYYGFACLCLCWQLAFLVISTDPVRHRPLMPVAVLEKFSYVLAVAVLWGQGRAMPLTPIMAGIDAVLGVLFVAAYLRTPARAENPR